MNRPTTVATAGTRTPPIKPRFYINKGSSVQYTGCVMTVILFSKHVIGYNSWIHRKLQNCKPTFTCDEFILSLSRNVLYGSQRQIFVICKFLIFCKYLILGSFPFVSNHKNIKSRTRMIYSISYSSYLIIIKILK